MAMGRIGCQDEVGHQPEKPCARGRARQEGQTVAAGKQCEQRRTSECCTYLPTVVVGWWKRVKAAVVEGAGRDCDKGGRALFT